MSRPLFVLPVAPDPANLGVMLDAEGLPIFTVDVNGERPDQEVRETLAALAIGLNLGLARLGLQP